MFKQKSNTAFNKSMLIGANVECMHETMKRLYQYVTDNKNVIGQSAVAKLMNEVPQTLNNWEARGISKQGLIKAQEIFGCNMQWIKTGKGLESIVFKNEAKQELAPYILSNTENVFENQLLLFYKKMSKPHQEALFDLANKMYIMDNAHDKKAFPYPNKPKKQKA